MPASYGHWHGAAARTNPHNKNITLKRPVRTRIDKPCDHSTTRIVFSSDARYRPAIEVPWSGQPDQWMLSRQSDGVRCRASGPGLWQVLPWAALAAAPGICRNSGLLAGFTARQEATAAVTRHFPVPEGLPGNPRLYYKGLLSRSGWDSGNDCLRYGRAVFQAMSAGRH
jgi:hypothetical protein